MDETTKRYIVKPKLREILPQHDMNWILKELGPGYNCIDSSLLDEAHIHIGLQEIRQVPPDCKPLANPHMHDAAEYYLVLGDLTVEVLLGEQKHEVSGPATIFVPAGMRHTIRPLRGKGYIVIVMGSEQYE